MYSTRVSIIQKSLYRQLDLNYLSSINYKPGSIINVPLGKKTSLAVVIQSVSLIEDKILIKKLPVEPKKIEKQDDFFIINNSLFKEITLIADTSAISVGYVFENLPTFIKNLEIKFEKIISKPRFLTLNKEKVFKKIEKLLAEQKKVILITPNQKYRNFFKKKYKNILNTEHLSIFSFSEIDDLNLIKPDYVFFYQSENPNYYTKKEPIFPLYKIVSCYFRIIGSQVFYVDSLFLEKKFIKIIDTEKSKSIITFEKEKTDKIFSNALTTKAIELLQENKKVLIFAPKNKIATSIICKDCQNYAKDSQEEHFSLIEEKDGVRYYISSNERLLAKNVCQFCNGTRLELLGITKHKQQEYWNDQINEIKHKDKLEFVDQKNLYNKKADCLVISSLNHLRDSFSYKSDELLLRSVLNLTDFFEIILIQNDKDKWLKNFSAKNLFANISKQKLVREKFGFPPFGFLIRIYGPVIYTENNPPTIDLFIKRHPRTKKELVNRFGKKSIRWQIIAKKLEKEDISHLKSLPIGFLYSVNPPF